jgi:hypothetical protein
MLQEPPNRASKPRRNMPSLFELIQGKPPALKLVAHQMVFTAVRLMADAKLGAVLVSDSYEGINGIFTESDCMRKVTARGLDPATTPRVATCRSR